MNKLLHKRNYFKWMEYRQTTGEENKKRSTDIQILSMPIAMVRGPSALISQTIPNTDSAVCYGSGAKGTKRTEGTASLAAFV